MAQQVTQGGTTTTSVYVGDVEEVSNSGSTTTTTAYYYADGKRIALSVNGTISYLAEDALGSASVALSTSGSATASVLYAPYGTQRYGSGTMPGTYGFTGQRADAVSGLDYYGARYYDPTAGQFTSADTVVPGGGFDLWGLSRYAYVQGNPENRTDPTGHINLMIGGDGAPAPIQNAFSGTYSWGVAPVVRHSGIRAPYRPPSRSTPPPTRETAPPPPPPAPAAAPPPPDSSALQGPTPGRARLIALRAGVGGLDDDPFLTWSSAAQEQFIGLTNALGAVQSKQYDLTQDPYNLWRNQPDTYDAHIAEVKRMQAALNRRLAGLRRALPEAADYLEPYVTEASQFDPVAVRGYGYRPDEPDGPAETEVQQALDEFGMGPTKGDTPDPLGDV